MALEREWQYPPSLRLSETSSCGHSLEKDLSSIDENETDNNNGGSLSLMDHLQRSINNILNLDDEEESKSDMSISGSDRTSPAQRFQNSFSILNLKEEKDEEEYERFEEPMNRLCYSQNDILKIVGDDDTFRNMKNLLRDRGCVTNSFLQQKVHLYVKHVRDQDR